MYWIIYHKYWSKENIYRLNVCEPYFFLLYKDFFTFLCMNMCSAAFTSRHFIAKDNDYKFSLCFALITLANRKNWETYLFRKRELVFLLSFLTDSVVSVNIRFCISVNDFHISFCFQWSPIYCITLQFPYKICRSNVSFSCTELFIISIEIRKIDTD